MKKQQLIEIIKRVVREESIKWVSGSKETLDQLNLILSRNKLKLQPQGPVTLNYNKSKNGSIEISLWTGYNKRTGKFDSSLPEGDRTSIHLSLRFKQETNTWKVSRIFDRSNVMGLNLQKNQTLTNQEVVDAFEKFLKQV